MGIFDFFKKKAPQIPQPPQIAEIPETTQSAQPPKPPNGYEAMYELLFCDNLDAFRLGKTDSYPLNVLLAERPDINKIKELANDKTCDSRFRIVANRILAANAVVIESRELMGVVLEVSLDDGVDVLAAYADGTARYINHSGKMIIWEAKNEQSNQLIKNLFSASVKAVQQIDPWNDKRKSMPARQMVRISFLVSDGLYFGEGKMDIMSQEPLAGPVIYAGIELLDFLTQQRLKN